MSHFYTPPGKFPTTQVSLYPATYAKQCEALKGFTAQWKYVVVLFIIFIYYYFFQNVGNTVHKTQRVTLTYKLRQKRDKALPHERKVILLNPKMLACIKKNKIAKGIISPSKVPQDRYKVERGVYGGGVCKDKQKEHCSVSIKRNIDVKNVTSWGHFGFLWGYWWKFKASSFGRHCPKQ